MAREYHVIWAGRARRGSEKRSAWELLCADYRRRLRRFVAVVDRPVKARGATDDRSRQRDEGQALLEARPVPAFTVVLDSRGKAVDSERFAARLGELRDAFPHPIAFLIGSDLGHGADVLAAADWRLGLGPMTFGHELARLVLYEQLYRSAAIDSGIKYHRPPL